MRDSMILSNTDALRLPKLKGANIGPKMRASHPIELW